MRNRITVAEKNGRRNRNSGNHAQPPQSNERPPRVERLVPTPSHDRSAVATALYALGRPYASDDTLWRQIASALRSWDSSESTQKLFERWSTRDGEREAAMCRQLWGELGDARRTGSATIEDLFKWAAGSGWIPPEGRSARRTFNGGAFELAEELVSARYVRNEADRHVPTLRYYRGEFHVWIDGRYTPSSLDEIRIAVVRFLGQRGTNVSGQLVSAVLDCIRALVAVPADCQIPCWLDSSADIVEGTEPSEPSADELIPARDALINVPAFLAGQPCTLAPTARFFSLSAVGCTFRATKPVRWKRFLGELWADDKASVDALQEWFGYVVMRQTDLQKALLIIGPARSGKGTLAKVLTALNGHSSTVAPKLADFAQHFGLAPLVDKTLAIIPDARLGNRHDGVTIVERLLSIIGEDAITIDRKHRDPITVKLGTRITILSNELPVLTDTAGALASRLIVLNLSRRFFPPDRSEGTGCVHPDDTAGVADPQLWSKLQTELPGILRWALRGWKRLSERGHFLQPDSSRSLLDQAAELASPVGVFVRDFCVVKREAKIGVTELYSRWKYVCEQSGQEPGNIQTFARDLRAVAPSVVTERRKSNGITVRTLVGIELSYPTAKRSTRRSWAARSLQ